MPITTLGFEDLPVGTVVTRQYAGRGVVMPYGAVIATDPPAHSGTRVLVPSYPEIWTGPFVLEFTGGQRHVRLFAGTASQFNPSATISGTLRAFDAGGDLVAQDGPKAVTANAVATVFEVNVAADVITRIELYEEASLPDGTKYEAIEAIDDLTFEGAPVAPVPTIAPVVLITAPANGQQVDITMSIVQGTVTGDGLLAAASITAWIAGPPHKSHLVPFSSLAPLSGSGTTRSFSLNVPLGVGLVTLIVEMENTAGLKGTGQAKIVNLPAALVARFNADGGAAAFGTIQWAVSSNACTLAVYNQGAIAEEHGMTRTVRGTIFVKWLQWILAKFDDLYALGVNSFCPTEDERDAPGASRAQNFRRGRIYARPAAEVFYVPNVFAEAIDMLGGEAATGVPISDPTQSSAAHTWLFQQFARPGQPGLPSTLEIKGTPPVLWISRQGGDLAALSQAGQSLSAATATLSQHFTCDGPEGPCSVSIPAPAEPVKNAGATYCRGTTYPWGPREWQAILGDYVCTPVVGFVENSHAAEQDDEATHEFNSPAPSGGFRSDWNITLRVLPPYLNLLAEHQDDLELEFEEYWANYFFTLRGIPQPGDLVFASGRWIIDCGHDDYSSEIHPPFVLVYMRTDISSAQPATVASIWVNPLYPGDPVELDLIPTPRPAPNAYLVINSIQDERADVTVEHTPDADTSSYVRLRFSTSSRQVKLDTNSGQMFLLAGRGYIGHWSILWQAETGYQIESVGDAWWP